MPVEIIEPLQGDLRTLRTIQAPHHVAVAADGTLRISSAAFKPGRDGSISVDLEESLIRASLELTSRYPSLPRAVALVSHRVQQVRQEGLSATHVPVEGNEHHGELRFANGSTKGQIKDASRNLANNCVTIVAIDVNEVQRLRSITA
ncbi:hypothetical protein [Sphingomonas hankookensis]|uniref:hypothetical protein n=1 Tax=Sphingomonas hankookensis TaxID=563996 RepID=UPI00234E8352|nr:hypothetical protein [Sphingomonas hankookensis]WCP71583.1 hypothetical protein PPZ50_14660 [Sphingomonas hankookensis]